MSNLKPQAFCHLGSSLEDVILTIEHVDPITELTWRVLDKSPAAQHDTLFQQLPTEIIRCRFAICMHTWSLCSQARELYTSPRTKSQIRNPKPQTLGQLQLLRIVWKGSIIPKPSKVLLIPRVPCNPQGSLVSLYVVYSTLTSYSNCGSNRPSK